MRAVAGAPHAIFPMSDPSRVGEARRHAAVLAASAGLDETEAGRVAIIVTELGNNLLRHARDGSLLLGLDEQAQQVEVIAIDKGPGIADLARSLQDGFSSSSTPGTGLGAVRRLSHDFDMHSVPGEGTVTLARVRAHDAGPRPHQLDWAGISIAAPGQLVCGDAWAVSGEGTSATLTVADGLGHGPDAAEAARAAIDAFQEAPLDAPRTVLERMHAAVRGTRGAAVSVLRVDADESTVRASGAGNITSRVVSGVSDRTILTQHGTIGLQIRKVDETTLPWPQHALIIMHSDGLETRWTPQRLMPVLGRDPALAAAILLRDHLRGRDDATVLVLRRKEAS